MSEPLNTKSSTFEEFHARHRDTANGKRLAWMADFYRAKEGVMKHKEVPLEWRVLELAKVCSWGNGNRDYIADPQGHPMTQREIASVLDVNFQRVCEAVEKLEAYGYLQREGRILLVVDDPVAARQNLPRPSLKKRNQKSHPGWIPDEERAKCFQFWEETSPEQFQEYQKIQAELEEVEREQKQRFDAVWAQYQEARKKSGTGRTNDSEDPERGGENVRNGVDDLSGTGRTANDPNLTVFTSTYIQLASCIKGEPERLVFEAVGKSGLIHLPGNLPAAIRNTAAIFAMEPPERRSAVLAHFQDDCRQIAGRRENKPKSWGILRKLIEDAIQAVSNASADEKATAQEQPPEPSVEEQIESLANLLEAKPDHPQADSWREQLTALKRKPVASEPSAQARKAGQA